MAEIKNPFVGLVKITSSDYSKYTALKVAGKMVFAEITGDGENAGKYIWANGVEYKVADATNLDELVRRVEDVSQYAINVSSALNDLSTFIRAEVSDLSTHVRTVTDASVTDLESWKSTHADPSLNAFDASLKDHETRIGNLENASNALGERIANVSQNVIDISTYVHTTVDASIDAIHTKDSEQDTSISDISTRLSNVAITAADNSIGVNNTSIALAGDNYVSLTATDNTVTASIKDSALVKGQTHTTDVSLATKGYVDDQIAVLEQALVFKGDITGTADASAKLTDAAVQAGYTYVATNSGEYNGKKFDAGDLIIVKEDSAAGSNANIIVVERNLDGAVTTGVTLSADYVILGNGDQSVKVSTLAFSDLEVAIANANSAIQGVIANSSTTNFIDASAAINSSIVTVTVGAKTHDVSTASDVAEGLATALGAKEYVDAQIAAHKVDTVTLNSSTPSYVETTATVSADGQTISASVGVITATLANASNGSTGLAMAEDVYAELTRVEEVTATSITTMSDSLGLGDNFGPGWSQGSGIANASSYREVIEELHGQVAGHVVNSFGGAVGAISVQGSNTNGDVSLWMDGSTLKAGVVGLNEVIAGAIDSSIKALDVVDTSVSGQVVIAVPETDGKVAPERIQLKINGQNFATSDGSMGAVIDGSQILVGGENAAHKDSSIAKAIADLSTAIDNISGDAIKSVVGETTISGDGTYVAVTATENPAGTVTLASELTLASNTYGSTAATGLVTDAYVLDFLAWAVISD